jgi:rfaE bifunctional protein kinase chain/domain
MTGKRIAVVGDLMLDRYVWGKVSRLSPEAPVPIIDLESEEARPGGAANVAQNIHSLGGIPLPVGVTGKDAEGRELVALLAERGYSVSGITTDPARSTTVKTRLIANTQHVARIDREQRLALPAAMRKKMIGFIEASLEKLDGIIFEDYDKGVIDRDLVESVTSLAESASIPVLVDPKYDNFFAYRRATLFKPNKKEAEEALGVRIGSRTEAVEAARAIQARLDADNVLLTMGSQGMILIERGGAVSHVETAAKKVADVSGAGDTVIATFGMALLGGATVREAAGMANHAGGVVCGFSGIVPIEKDLLIRSVLGESNHAAGRNRSAAAGSDG